MHRELRPLAAVVLACSLAACARPGRDAVHGTATADTPDVGFTVTTVNDGAGAPLEVAVWYPTEVRGTPEALGGWTQVVAPGAPAARGRRPLVVISHGSGGWFGGHYDTALALARAGFVVAALTHPGDNYRDQSRVTDVAARPRALRRVVDYMLGASPQRSVLDAARVGAFGFSNGGYTVLVAAGGVPDLTRFPAHCGAHPANDDCRLVRAGDPGLMESLATPLPDSVWAHDARIRAVVVAAPALGFAFTPDGLRDVTAPVQLWRAADDRILPEPAYADAVKAALPVPPEYHDVPGAGHFDFLAPCDPGTAARVPEICASGAGFDREAFHARFNRSVVAFFQRTLGAP